MFVKVYNIVGVPFNVIVVEDKNHEKYGKVVRFYDARYVGGFTEYGQFISDYFVSTLLESRERIEKNGLCLDNGISDWFIDGEPMKEVYKYIDMNK